MLGTEPVVEMKKAEGLSPSLQPIVKTPGRLDPQSVKVLTDRMQPDGTFEWDVPGGQWQLFVFFQQPVNTRVIGGVGVEPQLGISEAADAEIGAFYGKTVRAGFCDSLEVEAETYWTDNVLSEFRKRRGYDLTPWLPFIETPGHGNPYGPYESAPWFDGANAERVRKDYLQTVSDLWIDNFFAPLGDWLHNRTHFFNTHSP